ncbi:hypothetical protein Moror_11141 [Moniliophthora roreri MCA 2997]|uniref:C2H2-type domain-containing protein n=1 Tax=Moniliophthora roreri (strain MCA 2997) TaxID=1381753 RepID=V2WMZ5_MONRO|nr:hypothetical protein Moror_11141 [Moniliophthora roreri MCA 2997]
MRSICTICYASCPSTTSLTDHWETVHPGLHALDKYFETTPSPSLYPCPACHMVFPTLQTWELHITDRARLSRQHPLDVFTCDTDRKPLT